MSDHTWRVVMAAVISGVVLLAWVVVCVLALIEDQRYRRLHPWEGTTWEATDE